jgi:hypothetical protein
LLDRWQWYEQQLVDVIVSTTSLFLCFFLLFAWQTTMVRAACGCYCINHIFLSFFCLTDEVTSRAAWRRDYINSSAHIDTLDFAFHFPIYSPPILNHDTKFTMVRTLFKRDFLIKKFN